MSNLSCLIVVILLVILGDGFNCQNVSPPKGLRFHSKTSKSVTVQWNATINHTVYEYQVFYKKKTAGNTWSTKTVGNTTTEVKLEGLKPFTEYIAQVLVNTTVGTSNKSGTVEVRTSEDFPSAFPDITSKTSTSSSIYLEWTAIPKDKENGFLLGYAVYYIKVSDVHDYINKYKKFSVSIVSRNATMTGLRSYILYHFGVAAFNSKGIDVKAVTINQVNTIRTKEGVPNAPPGLRAKFLSFSKLHISWSFFSPGQANGIVHGYRYIVYNSQHKVIYNRTVSITTNSVDASVTACSGYVIQVRAWTGAGDGNYSTFNLTNSCEPPRITHFKERVLAALHSYHIVLPCNYTGFPKPSVSWILNDGMTIEAGYAQQHNVIKPGGTITLTKTRAVYENGSLVISFVEANDKGLYTCVINETKHGFGSATANTTVIVSAGTVTKTFELRLINEEYDNDLKSENKNSKRYKYLSAKIVSAVRRIYNNTEHYVIQGVNIIYYENGSVIVLFRVSASFDSAKNEKAVAADIVDIMVTNTQGGKLGSFSVGNLTVHGPPPPPTDLKVVQLRSKYVILEWKPPKYDDVYEVDKYSMQYRKHGDQKFKSVKTVKNSGSVISGMLDGLEGGEQYVIGIMSHRKTGDVNHDSQRAQKEILTPDSQLQMTLLVIVLPIALALLIIFIICCVLRILCREPKSENNNLAVRFSRPDGPREENPYDIGRFLEEFPCRWNEIPRSDLQIGKELGSGAFGTVVKAVLKLNDKTTLCAVKKLKDFATERENRDLFNELSIMAQVGYHPHVISLIGACTVNGPLWVVVKLAENGCLLDYLQKHRRLDYVDHAYQNVAGSSNAAPEIEELDKLQKLKFAHGIAKGMSHLEKLKCVHRDMAARNVLLGKHMVAMVSDFGLSRDIYESGMYEDVRGGKRPVRWMAPESIEDYTCTTKSDVWSFGVTLWEIETAGTIPYAGVESGMDILNEVKKGFRLEQPKGCDSDVYDVMLSTWRANPLDRPMFQELTGIIEEMLTGISEYLEIQPEDDDQEMFTSPYDEVHISTTDLDDTVVDIPNGNAPNAIDTPPYSVDLNMNAAEDSETQL